MRLDEYIEKTSQRVEDFANKAGLSMDSIYKYMRGDRMPHPTAVVKINVATKGKVTANDFYDLPITKNGQIK